MRISRRRSALGEPEGQAATAGLATFASGGVTIFADGEQVALPITLPATMS